MTLRISSSSGYRKIVDTKLYLNPSNPRLSRILESVTVGVFPDTVADFDRSRATGQYHITKTCRLAKCPGIVLVIDQ